uniref:BTB domain-containing protein n=1 Tax=Panagrolaimus sp. PS1159 TaxID=55785 RepID=A0AC35FCU9_9BILA
MDAQEIIYSFQMQRFEVFKTQDVENGKFDVAFEIDGKTLYAHKAIICLISTTLDSMLSDRWRKPDDEHVKIDGYSFDNFKEFLTFIYSGKCKLSNENILSMVDIAEFFGVKLLKIYCEKFLTKMKFDSNNVYGFRELSQKYSLNELKKVIDKFISDNILYVCKWAENRVTKLRKTVELEEICEETKNLGIKNEMLQFLPFFNFEKMKIKFFNDFIVQKRFIFTDDEFNEILQKRIHVLVKVTDGRGKSMNGKFRCDQIKNIDALIQSVRIDHPSYVFDYNPGECPTITWDIFPTQPKLPMPSKLFKNDNIEFYVVLMDYGGYWVIALKKRRSLLDSDYLLAEMFAEDGFNYGISFDHKIEFFRPV